jgi:uncharacterized membrane protein HdeD (DUF308 family)
VTEAPKDDLSRHWGVLLTVGLVTFGLGAALTVWPGETVAVVAVLLGLQLLFSGCVQLVLALVSRRGLARWATALAGAAAGVVGALLLARPLQTLTFIGWAAGLCVVATGAVDLLAAFSSRAARHRGWQAVRGVVGVALGVWLVADPHRSLGLLVVIACVWLISYGFLTVVAALMLRSERRVGSDPGASSSSITRSG